MNEDTKVQDNNVEGQPQSDLHADSKPAEEAASKDRTAEQFEKLTQKNRELSEKLAAYEQSGKAETVLDSLRPKAAPPIDQPVLPTSFNLPEFGKTQVQDQEKELFDQDGYVNPDALQKSLAEARAKAIKAEQEAKAIRDQFVKYEEDQQTRVAHAQFPELDPHSDKFDKRFYELTRNELIGQMMQGKKDVLAAAKKVSEYYKAPEKKEANGQEAKEQKQQINAGSRSASPGSSITDDADLVRATRMGKKGALAERLKRSGL